MREKHNVGIDCRLSRYAQEQGWNLYAAYCDNGVSGISFDRPMFNQMVADARAGKINLILCKDLRACLKNRKHRLFTLSGRICVSKILVIRKHYLRFSSSNRTTQGKNPVLSLFSNKP